MRLILAELKKMMYYQHGLIYILGFLILSLFGLFVMDSAYNDRIELYQDEYNYYLDQVKGRLTDEKEALLEDEAKQMAEVDIQLTQLYNAYYKGDISEEEFEQKRIDGEALLKNKQGFEEIFQQYLYVAENPENRFFIYPNGWYGLFDVKYSELFLFIVIVLLITRFYAYNYQYEMENIEMTTKKGSRLSYVVRFLLATATVVILCLCSFVMTYLYYRIRYGLVDGEFPIQSIYLFKESMIQTGLLETYFYICGLKILGYVALSMLILIVTVIFKKQIVTVFVTTSIITIPYVSLGDQQAYLIQPLGLILSKGYFTQARPRNLILLGVATIIVCLILYFIGRISTINKWLLLFLPLLLLTSCTGQQEESIVYNLDERMEHSVGGYQYYFDVIDNDFVRVHEETGAKESLVRNPFEEDVKYESCFFVQGEYFYYIKRGLENTPIMKENSQLRGGSNMYNFAVVQVNMQTFEETVIFEKNMGTNRSGILKEENKKWGFMRGINGFYLDKDTIYIIDTDAIRMIDRMTSQITAIGDINTVYNIAFDGQYIYYVGDRYRLSKYDVNTQEKSSVDDIITEDFRLNEGRIEYKNLLDGERRMLKIIRIKSA